MGMVGEFTLNLQREYQILFDKCQVLPHLETVVKKHCENILKHKDVTVLYIPWYICGILQMIEKSYDIHKLNITNNWSIDRTLWAFEHYIGWDYRIQKQQEIKMKNIDIDFYDGLNPKLWGGSNIVSNTNDIGLGTLLKYFIENRYVEKQSSILNKSLNTYDCKLFDIVNNNEFDVEIVEKDIGSVFVKLAKTYENERYSVIAICLKS